MPDVRGRILGAEALSESLTPEVPVVAVEQPARRTSAGKMRTAGL